MGETVALICWEEIAALAEKKLPWKRLVRVCAWCKRMLDENGVWREPFPVCPGEALTHGICPECLEVEGSGGDES